MRRLFGRRARGRDDESRADDYAAPPDQVPDMDGEDADEFEAFVPVEREHQAYDTYEPYDVTEAGDDDDVARAWPEGPGYDDANDARTYRRRRIRVPRVRLPRPRVPVALRWDMLLLATGLIAAGIFSTLLVQDALTGDIVRWWPVALVAVALVWMLVALVRRHVASFLGAAAFAGVGLSLLMDAQDIARFEETLLGVVLVTVGLGIVIRGFLLRQREPV